MKQKIKVRDEKHLIVLLNTREISLSDLELSDDLIRYLKRKKESEKKHSDGKVTFP